MAKSRVYGQSKLRRQLRRFPDAVTEELQTEIEYSAEELRATMEQLAPKDEGQLAEAAQKVVSRDGLSAKIGYGNVAGFKRAWKRGGFKAIWQEFGTVNHPAQPFVRPAYRMKLRGILDRIDGAVNRVLHKASNL